MLCSITRSSKVAEVELFSCRFFPLHELNGDSCWAGIEVGLPRRCQVSLEWKEAHVDRLIGGRPCPLVEILNSETVVKILGMKQAALW